MIPCKTPAMTVPRTGAVQLACFLIVLVVASCGETNDTPPVAAASTETYEQIITRLEKGDYQVYLAPRPWKEDAVRVAEIADLRKHKKAYPWLARALHHPDTNIAETVRDLFHTAGIHEARNAKLLLKWYDVPEGELVWNGLIWEPMPKRIAEVDARGTDIMNLRSRRTEYADAIWRVDALGKREACIASHFHYVKANGAGKIYYAYLDVRSNNIPLRILECDRNGVAKRYQIYSPEGWHLSTALTDMTWLSDSRIFVDTHVNPSLGIGLEIDLDAETLTPHYGTDFTWDNGRKRLAYLRPPPHFGTPPDIPDKLMVGQEMICEVPRHLHSRLRWHPTEDKLLVLIPPEGAKPGELIVVDFSSGPPPSVRRFRVKPEDL